MNLTWEIEPVVDQQQQGEGDGDLSEDDEQPLPIPAFQVYFCEMHSWGPQRCKSRVLNTQQSATHENHIDDISTGREFSLAIDNLRMATKYSFHVRHISEGAAFEPKGRRIDQSSMPENDLENGEMIIIPTKGCKLSIFKIYLFTLNNTDTQFPLHSHCPRHQVSCPGLRD